MTPASDKAEGGAVALTLRDWKLTRAAGNAIVVTHKDGSGCVVNEDETAARIVPGAILYRLANDLLATPAANGPGEAGWLPIESAPKDGTDILIWCAPWSCGSEARYIEDEGWWLANNHPTDHWGDQKYPTHWQPLPAPPGASASTPQPGMVTVPSQDAKRLDWLERMHTLHQSVEILYVVDGYEVIVMHEDGITKLSETVHGDSLRTAIDAALLAAAKETL